MYDSVLIPTDGSDGSAAAIRAGVELAASFGASVHVLYVVDERFVADDFDYAVEDAETAGETALDDAADIAAERGVDVSRHLRRGVPHEEILDAIDAYDADVVVMGTHGRTGVQRLVHLGSTTERVVRHAPVQVVTVPLHEE